MQLVVGGYTHDANTVWISPLSIRRVPSQRGRTMLQRHQWGVHGVLIGTSQANLTTKIAALRAGYENITSDVILYDNNGVATDHKITYANTINGIRASLVFPGSLQPGGWGAGAEYTYIRYFVGQIDADVEAFEDNILAYFQTMKYSLGGVGYRVLEAFTGPPQQQFVKAQSKFWGVQSGVAIGAYTHPNPADPLVGVPPMPEKSSVSFTTPQMQGSRANRGFRTNWTYYYESPGSLLAIPPPNP